MDSAEAEHYGASEMGLHCFTKSPFQGHLALVGCWYKRKKYTQQKKKHIQIYKVFYLYSSVAQLSFSLITKIHLIL